MFLGLITIGKQQFPHVNPPLMDLSLGHSHMSCHWDQGEEITTFLSTSSLRKMQGAMRLPLSLLFFHTKKPCVLSHSSQNMPSTHFTSFVTFLWMHSSIFTCLLNGRTQNHRRDSKQGCTISK